LRERSSDVSDKAVTLVPRILLVRSMAATLLALLGSMPAFSATGSALTTTSPASASTIVIGFVGGFVRHDDPRHGPVQLARRIERSAGSDAYVQVFENRHRKRAYHAILRLLDSDHDGSLSADEKSRARIILFGHSWGAAAAVLLARDLKRESIPVLLTVQVDSVAKLWQNDSVIPANVIEAVNFYQTHGLVHGRKQITAADPGRTQILGNYLEDYRKDPVKCDKRSWFDRLTPSHAQSECDPRVWSQIEELMRQQLATPSAAASTAAAIVAQP
jgi:pimeloyl-ACP methyl ester carboxylesterase